MKAADLAPGAAVLALLTVAAALGQVNFSRWDNMETFLPAIWYAHTQILQGHFPFWNPLQNLGEPMHALGIAGALYPPYTAAVAVTRLMNWPQAYALDLIAILHAAFGAVGISMLLTDLGVRRSIAFGAAVSAMLSGYAVVVGSVWVHVLPNLAWSMWAMWGLQRVILRGNERAGISVAIVALTAVFLTGHVQMAANVWLAVWLWTCALATALRTFRSRLPTFCLIAVAAALMATPVLLPTALILPDAQRWTGDLEAGPGFPLAALIGLLVPVVGGSDTAISTEVLVTTFIGAWIVPALLLGTGVMAFRRGSADAAITRAFVVSIMVAAIFVWLNLGPSGGLYSALHALPVWSRFRIPFKYFERAVPLLAMAAALGLELAVRHPPPRRYALAALGLAVLAGTAWLLQPANQPLALLTGTVAVLTPVAAALMPHRRFARVLPGLAIVQGIGVIAIANGPTQYKRYLVDRQHSARLPIADTVGRVLPLSEGLEAESSTRPLARFYAPMLDGYASATGHRFALTSARMQAWFPTLLSGVPSHHGNPYERWLTPHFMNSLGVNQLVVAAGDANAIAAAARAFPNAAVTVTPHARVYRLPTTPTRAYLARQQLPGDQSGITAALRGPSVQFVAAVDGDLRTRILPSAELTELKWGIDRIEARVRAPEGGLLVFSTSYSSEWIAEVDGSRQATVPASGLFAGIWVPPNATTVVLRIRRWPLYIGFLVAAGGVALVLVAALVETRAKQADRVPDRGQDSQL
jgi:hypothetical protein